MTVKDLKGLLGGYDENLGLELNLVGVPINFYMVESTDGKLRMTLIPDEEKYDAAQENA